VVVVSRHTRELALAFGASPERVTIIHPGVDAVVAPERDPASRRVLVIARLDDHYKGHDVLIRAVPLVRSRVPGVVVDIVGDGHLRSWLEGLVAQSGVADSVVFHGAVDDGTRDALLASARVFCLPSRLEADGSGGEGFGIVFLEAAAYGVPVVAGAAGGTLDAVANGVTGLLVDPTDHVAVADALVRLLTDDELNERCGRAGRARVIEFSWAAQGRAAEALLRSTT
jgi:phosphatidylinositol alpha-1,6-mannosyltransferase